MSHSYRSALGQFLMQIRGLTSIYVHLQRDYMVFWLFSHTNHQNLNKIKTNYFFEIFISETNKEK